MIHKREANRIPPTERSGGIVVSAILAGRPVPPIQEGLDYNSVEESMMTYNTASKIVAQFIAGERNSVGDYSQSALRAQQVLTEHAEQGVVPKFLPDRFPVPQSRVKK